MSALDWSVEAMCQAADRVQRVPNGREREAFAAIGETLWWIGIVDENLRERKPEIYGSHVTFTLGERPLLMGLRYARNRFTHGVDVLHYVEPDGILHGDPRGYRSIWKWRSLPAEHRDYVVGNPGRSARKQYKAYQAAVAGTDVHQSFVNALSVLRGVAWSSSTD